MFAGWFHISLLLVSVGAAGLPVPGGQDACNDNCDSTSFLVLSKPVSMQKAVKADTDVEVLQGYASTEGDNRRSTALKGKVKSSGYKASDAYVKVTKSTSELETALSVEMDFSVTFLKDGISDKMKWYQDLEVKETYISVAVRSYQVSDQKVTDPSTPIVVKEDVEIPRNSTFKRFYNTYGDKFVDSVNIGGEFMAVYIFYTKTKEERTTVENSLRANGVFGGTLSVNSTLNTAMNKVQKETEMEWEYQEKVIGADITGPGPENMVQFALDFQGRDLDSPTVIDLSLKCYNEVPELGTSAFNQVCTNLRVLQGLSDQYNELSPSADMARSIQNTYKRYFGIRNPTFTDTTLDTNLAKLDADMASIREAFNSYRGDPIKPVVQPLLPSLELGSPCMYMEWKANDIKGTNLGTNYQVPEETPVAAKYDQTRMDYLDLYAGGDTGGVVHKLCTTFSKTSGRDETSCFGGGTKSPKSFEISYLDGNDKITEVKAWTLGGSPLQRLEFWTKDEMVLGGGSKRGVAKKENDFKIESNCVLVGFRGKAANSVQSFGPIQFCFREAVWDSSCLLSLLESNF